MKTLDFMVNDHYESEAEAVEDFRAIVSSLCGDEIETEQGRLAHCRSVEDYEGYTLHYCYGADFYFIEVPEDSEA